MKKIQLPNLDAWRFVAFLTVFLFHSLYSSVDSVRENAGFQFFKYLFDQGHLGVNFFFVLSGFLITYLLLVEEQAVGKYKIGDFWMRRILRIWPLYFAVLVYGFLIFRYIYPVISGKAYAETANPFYYLTFLPNFDLIYNGHPLNNALLVLWSVGVEEQFYLFWPLIFWVRKARIPVLLSIILLCILFRYDHAGESEVIKYHSFSVMANLALGCLLACISFEKKIGVKSLHISKVLNGGIYLTGFILVFLYATYAGARGLVAIYPLVIGVFFAYIIFEQVFVANSVFDLGRIRLFEYWGKYTYGLYCLHMIGIMVSHNITRVLKLESSVAWVILGDPTLALLLSLGMAWLSYRFLEKPFLLLKNRFAVVFNQR